SAERADLSTGAGALFSLGSKARGLRSCCPMPCAHLRATSRARPARGVPCAPFSTNCCLFSNGIESRHARAPPGLPRRTLAPLEGHRPKDFLHLRASEWKSDRRVLGAVFPGRDRRKAPAPRRHP